MHFEKNMGGLDRGIRIAVAFVLGYMYLTGMVTGWLAIVCAVAACVMLLTSIVSFCPLYTLVGIKTCSN